MKIYLLNPPFVKNFVRSSRCTWIPIAGSSWPPIFLAYATGLLEKNGHKAKLVDGTVGDWNLDKILNDVKEFEPDITVVYISLDSLESDVKVAKSIKEKAKTKIVFVGPWCAIEPEKMMEKYPVIDILIRREFEWPLHQICQDQNIKDIGWLVWRNESGQIVTNQDGGFMNTEQLDSLPFAADVYRRHLNIKDYKQSSLAYPFVDTLTSRGCAWGKCTFCLWPQTIHKDAMFRMRSIESVIEELKFIKNEMPDIKEVFFQDDMLPPGRLKDIAQAIIDNNIKMEWSGYAKTNLTYDILKLAKKSGCRFLHVGYETGDQQILNNVDKGEIVEKMEEFTKDAKNAGVKIHGDFIFGLPGETKETIQKTIAWAKKLNISDYQFVVPQPHPATCMYKELDGKGLLTEDGKPNYPHLTIDQLEHWRFEAYKKIYLNPKYVVTHVLGSWNDKAEFARLFKVAWRGFPKLVKALVKFRKA
ncbi:B12-binding domain-containing radical SAM protein [Patescibacteria group bacterium]|nr:B12-binding domain-containing radical SAM protein [Patescibacteria group bacterium]